MRVRLTRKFANLIDGIDLSKANAGEILDVSVHEAHILMAEGWAEYEGGTPALDKADEHPREHPRPKPTRRSAKKR
jgi:hypothetical protein